MGLDNGVQPTAPNALFHRTLTMTDFIIPHEYFIYINKIRLLQAQLKKIRLCEHAGLVRIPSGAGGRDWTGKKTIPFSSLLRNWNENDVIWHDNDLWKPRGKKDFPPYSVVLQKFAVDCRINSVESFIWNILRLSSFIHF